MNTNFILVQPFLERYRKRIIEKRIRTKVKHIARAAKLMMAASEQRSLLNRARRHRLHDGAVRRAAAVARHNRGGRLMSGRRRRRDCRSRPTPNKACSDDARRRQRLLMCVHGARSTRTAAAARARAHTRAAAAAASAATDTAAARAAGHNRTTTAAQSLKHLTELAARTRRRRRSHRVHHLIQHIRLPIVAHQIRREILSRPLILGHRATHLTTIGVRHLREMPHRFGTAQIERINDRWRAVAGLVRPQFHHLIERRRDVFVAVRLADAGDVLAGVGEGRGVAAAVVREFAQACIAAGHVGEIIVPGL